MTDSWLQWTAIVGAGSLALELFAIFFVVTVAFKRIEEVERRIATSGKQLDLIRRTFRGGLVGRWVRAFHVFNYFLLKNIPLYGEVLSSRIGDEASSVPTRLILWVVLPVGFAALFGGVFIAASIVLICFYK